MANGVGGDTVRAAGKPQATLQAQPGLLRGPDVSVRLGTEGPRPKDTRPHRSLAQGAADVSDASLLAGITGDEHHPFTTSEAASGAGPGRRGRVVAVPRVLLLLSLACPGKPGPVRVIPMWSLPHQAWVLAEGGGSWLLLPAGPALPDVRDPIGSPSSCRTRGGSSRASSATGPGNGARPPSKEAAPPSTDSDRLPPPAVHSFCGKQLMGVSQPEGKAHAVTASCMRGAHHSTES